MKNSYVNYALLLLLAFSCLNCEAKSNEFAENRPIESIIPLQPKNPIVLDDATSENKIQVAILLDTSSSMDGLIEQAKSRLWNIVNTLTTLKHNGKTPNIEIALYE